MAPDITPASSSESGATPFPALVTRFATLFAGYEKAHGRFEPERISTEDGTAPAALYAEHLLGTAGLGIINLREDDTVLFGALDYDAPTMDHAAMAQRIEDLKLPLVLCRSKSGGGHFYCFTSEPVAASVMRTRLSECAERLGITSLPSGDSIKIFPRQSTRAGPADVGGWINLPYWAGATGNLSRAAQSPEGPLALYDGLWLMAARQVDAARMGRSWSVPRTSNTTSAMFPDGPPCLQHYEHEGTFPEGEGKSGMRAIVIYLQKRYGDAWRDHFLEYNQLAHLRPEELVQVENTRQKNYACGGAPIRAVCQQLVCVRRRYGVGGGVSDPGADASSAEYTGVTKYSPENDFDPCLWGLEVNGSRVLVNNEVFANKRKFNEHCLDKLSLMPVVMTQAQWERVVATLAEEADVVPLLESQTPSGQLLALVNKFLGRGTASSRDELLLDKPFVEEGRIYFLPESLMNFLVEHKARDAGISKLWKLLERTQGAEVVSWSLSGHKKQQVWSVPGTRPTLGLTSSSPEQTDDF